MKQLFFTVGVVCLIAMLLPTCTPAPEPESTPESVFNLEAEEAAIRAVMERKIAAHNNHDAKGVVAEKDESYEGWEGDIRGPAAEQEYWEEFYRANKDFQTKVTEEIGIIFVTPDVAIWKARGESSGGPRDDGKPMTWLAASLRVKKNGNWREVAYFFRPIEE